MERLLIQIPEKKSKLIKSLLKELGAIIEPNANTLALDLNLMLKRDNELSTDEIVEETRKQRTGK